MAAAILMMNMHGAVMAADKDLTIFRYSDKVPFAIMVDPTSQFPWEDIIMRYQTEKSISSKRSFKLCVEDFASYLTDVFNKEFFDLLNDECEKKIICVGFENNSMFPHFATLTMNENEDFTGIRMCEDVDEISVLRLVYHQHLGNCANIRILFGGMSDDIKEQLQQLCVTELGNLIGDDTAAELINKHYDHFSREFDTIQFDSEVTKAISDFTVKDMVAMAENLIDTEGLRQSQEANLASTREIAVITLAEGVKWIKHSLYGA